MSLMKVIPRPPDKQRLALVEQFSSVQGEGGNAGRRAYFVRFSGCNLDCVFADGAICDTPWQKAKEKPTVQSVVDTIRDQRHDLVILTGGEPSIAKGIRNLIQNIRKQVIHHVDIAIESNGVEYLDAGIDWYVVSPKQFIAHRRPVKEMEPCEEAMQHADELRLVVTPEVPIDAYAAFTGKAIRYVSPAVISDGSGDVNFHGFVPGAVETALKMVELYGWRLSLQTHKFLGVR